MTVGQFVWFKLLLDLWPLGFNLEFSTSQDDFAKIKLSLSLGGGACLSLVF